jgi:hypothetical protein
MIGFEAPAIDTKAIDNMAKQVQFAIIVALTRTARDCADAAKRNLADEFILKNKYTERGIRVTPAKKGPGEPFAEVYTRDKYIAQHEEGGTRQLPGEGWAPVAVRDVFGVAENKVLPKALKPNQIRNLKQHKGRRIFLADDWKGQKAIMAIHNGRPRMLYVHKQSVDIRRNEWFYDAVNQEWDKQFNKRYTEALGQNFGLKIAK